MKASYRNGRKGKGGRVYSAKHNDRSFDMSNSPHINSELSQYNKYYLSWFGMLDEVNKPDMERFELDLYREYFYSTLEMRNEMYRNNGHPERCKTIEDLYKSERYCPEETILQLGNRENKVDRETFIKVVEDYCKDFIEQYEGNCKILDVAIHFDEDNGTPHAHMRRVWTYDRTDNLIDIGQNKALEQMGIPLPSPGKKIDKFNNRKITFTAMDRERFRDIAMSHGVELDEYEHTGRQHLEKNEYILKKRAEELDNAEINVCNKEYELQERERLIQEADRKHKKYIDEKKIEMAAIKKKAAAMQQGYQELMRKSEFDIKVRLSASEYDNKKLKKELNDIYKAHPELKAPEYIKNIELDR